METNISWGNSIISWVICTIRNDIIFDKFRLKTYIQVLFRATHLMTSMCTTSTI
jgi:hypothetical protein